MNSELKNLEKGGWRGMPEFLLFRSAMEGIAEGDDGTSYFKKFVDTFFERYRLSFESHVLVHREHQRACVDCRGCLLVRMQTCQCSGITHSACRWSTASKLE